MQRYLLFGGEHYYPSGGMFDLCTTSDSLSELKEIILEKEKEDEYGYCEWSWWHVYDVKQDQWVADQNGYSGTLEGVLI